MNNRDTAAQASVDQLPIPARSTVITDELTRLAGAVRAASPKDAAVTFDFDDTLEMHVDVRNLEDIARLEVLLPTLCGNIFANSRRGSVNNHPFLHRLTVSVDRTVGNVQRFGHSTAVRRSRVGNSIRSPGMITIAV